MNRRRILDILVQIAIPVFTLVAQALTALKHPEWGLVANLIAQPFWLYSSWKAFREIGQSGMFITTVFFSLITTAGVFNYWFR